MPDPAASSGRERGILAALLALGAVVRIAYHELTSYSPADEAHYVDSTRFLLDSGWSHYRELVQRTIGDPDTWLYPTPLRYGHLALTSLACQLRSPCDASTLAWLSTAAGVASLLLTYLVGRRLIGGRAALLATALSIPSPLQLGLGRRALQDEVVCAVSLLAIWALLALLQGDGLGTPRQATGRLVAWVFACAFALSVKESFVLLEAALLVLYALGTRRRPWRVVDLVVVAAPPTLYLAGFALVGGGLDSALALVRIAQGGLGSEYSVQYGSGPPHRVLFDLFVLAPAVCLLAVGALWDLLSRPERSTPGTRALATLTLLVAVAFMGLSKGIRLAAILDPLMRLLAAQAVMLVLEGRRGAPSWATGAALLNAAVELPLFHQVFVAGQTYDPQTYNLLLALAAVPRANAVATTWSGFPAAFLGTLGLGIAAIRGGALEALVRLRSRPGSTAPGRPDA